MKLYFVAVDFAEWSFAIYDMEGDQGQVLALVESQELAELIVQAPGMRETLDAAEERSRNFLAMQEEAQQTIEHDGEIDDASLEALTSIAKSLQSLVKIGSALQKSTK